MHPEFSGTYQLEQARTKRASQRRVSFAHPTACKERKEGNPKGRVFRRVKYNGRLVQSRAANSHKTTGREGKSWGIGTDRRENDD